jgi:hypothetical protein
MLAELALANDWRPRWYYIMRNKTTGLLYAGQTVNLETRRYCGSGRYWVAHCKKHGGHNRDNIEIVEQFFSVTKDQAQQWLDTLEKNHPNYYERSNKTWANRTRETTSDSAFAGLSQKERLEYSTLGGKAASSIPGLCSRNGKTQGDKNRDSGHMKKIQQIGCVAGGKVAGKLAGRRSVESGRLLEAARLGGKTVSLSRHQHKDADTGKSCFAVKLGKNSGETRKLMSQFCEEHGITKPGNNFKNMDRESFNQWRATYVTGVSSV